MFGEIKGQNFKLSLVMKKFIIKVICSNKTQKDAK